MSTIHTKGSYKVIRIFLEKGGKISDNNTNDYILKVYYQYLVDLEIKTTTIHSKLKHIYVFERYVVANNKTFKTINKQDVYNYINEYSKFNWELSYQDHNKFQIKFFLNWAYKNNITKISGDMVLPKIVWHRKTNIRTYYTNEEIIKFLNAIDINTNQGKEDYLIFSLICYLGLRISDVTNLKLSNIDFNNNTISFIQYKTDKFLTLPLIDKVKYPLLDYLKNVRPSDADIDYIFITNMKPYKNKSELKTHRHKVKNYLEKAGVNINGRKHGFHSLRHSFSTSLLNEGVSLYSISTILGHQHLDTTTVYLDTNISKLKELALEVPYVK